MLPIIKICCNRLGYFRLIRLGSSCQYSNKIYEEDGPIKYSKSPAIRWKAQDSRTGGTKPRLWYEPYVVGASLTIFLVYFTILRSENDIDVGLNRTLYSRIAGLEKSQLLALYEYNKENGLEIKSIEKRLQEIEIDEHVKQ